MSEFKRAHLTKEQAFDNLKSLFAKYGPSLNMRQMFMDNPQRFEAFSHRLQTPDGEILFDFSKNLINQEIMDGLIHLVNIFLLKRLFIISIYFD